MRALLLLTKENTDESIDSTKLKESLGFAITDIETIKSTKYQKSVAKQEKVDQQRKAFNADIKVAINQADANDQLLMISSFEALEKNILSIKMLEESKINFRILDFPNLNQDNISLLCQLLNYQSEQKGKKISEGLSERRKDGGKIGNPSIASDRNISKATYRRKDLAYVDEANRNARVKIAELKAKGVNFNQIAHHLNDANMETRRGGRFHAKGVERLFQMHCEIEKRFKKIDDQRFEKVDDLEPLIDVMRKVDDLPNVLTQIHNYKNYHDQISFKLSNIEQKDQVNIVIRDHEATVVYNEKWDGVNENITIDVVEAMLLPGIYYLEINYPEGAKVERIYRAFYVKEEVRGLAET